MFMWQFCSNKESPLVSLLSILFHIFVMYFEQYYKNQTRPADSTSQTMNRTLSWSSCLLKIESFKNWWTTWISGNSHGWQLNKKIPLQLWSPSHCDIALRLTSNLSLTIIALVKIDISALWFCNTQAESAWTMTFCFVGPHESSKSGLYTSLEGYMFGTFSWD